MTVVLEPLRREDPAAPAPADVVLILGYTSWSGAVRRGYIHAEDRLTLELMQSPRVRRLLVCNPYRSALAKLARTVAGQRDEPFPGSDRIVLHEPLRLRREDPTSVGAIARSCAAYERSVRRRVASLGLERPAVVTTHPLMAGFGAFDWAGPVTYYANDDLTAFPPLSPWWPAYEVAFERLRAAGRGAVALTPKSLASVDPSGPSAVIPCGLEPSEWRSPSEPPSWFAELPRPRFLYVGTLDPRVEVETLANLANMQPGGAVVLVGPCPDPDHYATLRRLPNVTIHAAVARAELPGLVGAADVGLIPHVVSEQTRAMSPLKLYEYLAAGLPVASVELPGTVSVCTSRTLLTASGEGFAEAASAALRLGRWDERERHQFIDENSWERRFGALLDLALRS